MNICAVFKVKILYAWGPTFFCFCFLIGWRGTACQVAPNVWAQPIAESRLLQSFLPLGARACVVNADLTQTRNSQRPPQPLTATAKQYLQPWFGALVDQVRVVWQARLNDRLVFGGQILAPGSRAQTYGYQIYVASSQGVPDPGSTQQLLLLSHELVHAEQYVRAGRSLRRFCQAYVQAWEQSAGVYADNPLEQEAFERAFAFAQWLARQFPAPAAPDQLRYSQEGEGPQGRTVILPRRLPETETASSRPQPPARQRP